MVKTITTVDVSLIDLSKEQEKRWTESQEDGELTASVKANGIMSPLALAPNKERFIIISGVRRYCAAAVNNLDIVPAIIYNVGVDDALVLGLHENLFRKNPNPIELAKQLIHLEKEYRWTRRDIARKVGKSESWVTQRIAILDYAPIVQEHLESGEMSVSQAREISRIKEISAITRLTRQTINSGASVRTLVEWVKDEILRIEAAAKKPEQRPEPPPTTAGKEGEITCFACGRKDAVAGCVAVRLCKGCHKELDSGF